ncbi:hypothetical protein NMD1_03069 [Novosphingobium sp. MD-1]|nr:hypothetical protein NMD1_03069 [Novosphingobium sp. MD-1]
MHDGTLPRRCGIAAHSVSPALFINRAACAAEIRIVRANSFIKAI